MSADMVTTGVAAQLMGTTPETVAKWIAEGRAIGMNKTPRSYRLPKWQFEPVLWDALPALTHALGSGDGWSLLSFLESPCGGLGGRTPRQAIEQGDVARAIDLAMAMGA